MLEMPRLLLVSLFAWSALAQMNTNTEIGKKSGSKTKRICTRHEYRPAAAKLLENLKYDVDPCDDFYQFSCGNFIERQEIPEGSKYVDHFSLIPHTLVQQTTEIITEERPETDPNHFKLPNKFFKSCMNTTLIDDLVDQPIQQISNSVGGWPVVVGDSWDNDNSWNWEDVAKKLRRLGFSTDYIMTLLIETNRKNNTTNIFKLYEPTFVFNWDFYKTSLKKYYDFMVDAAISFGASKRAVIRELPKSINFEMALVDISKTDRNVNDKGNLLTIKQLQELYPYIQWLDLINGLLPEGFTVNENEIINLLAPSFFDKLGDLLARTDKRTIANYIMWKVHYFSMSFLSKGFRNKRHQFKALALGSQSQVNILDECVRIAFHSLPISVSSIYAHKYFKKISKTAVTKIFKNIGKAFTQTLHESQWLDKETKEEAKRKLHSMKAIIGFHDELFDVARVEEYYRALEIDQNKYFQSFLNIRTFLMDKQIQELRMPANETEWLSYTITSVKSFVYELKQNRLRIPAAFIRGEFFNTQHPNYMNYGSIGSIIAHEMSHAFFGGGRKYCADCTEREWWQRSSTQAFSEKQKCLVEQYNNYTDKQTGLKINGSQTLEENIADNSGVKFSYLAYKQWQDKHGKEPRLPGLKYTPQQIFWISFAQSFCGKFSFDEMKKRVNTDTHSPHEFRILGVLRNMKEFSRDFHCPDNSPMNPVQKCEIW